MWELLLQSTTQRRTKKNQAKPSKVSFNIALLPCTVSSIPFSPAYTASHANQFVEMFFFSTFPHSLHSLATKNYTAHLSSPCLCEKKKKEKGKGKRGIALFTETRLLSLEVLLRCIIRNQDCLHKKKKKLFSVRSRTFIWKTQKGKYTRTTLAKKYHMFLPILLHAWTSLQTNSNREFWYYCALFCWHTPTLSFSLSLSLPLKSQFKIFLFHKNPTYTLYLFFVFFFIAFFCLLCNSAEPPRGVSTTYLSTQPPAPFCIRSSLFAPPPFLLFLRALLSETVQNPPHCTLQSTCRRKRIITVTSLVYRENRHPFFKFNRKKRFFIIKKKPSSFMCSDTLHNNASSRRWPIGNLNKYSGLRICMIFFLF